MGPGTFCVLVAAAIAVILCFFKDCVSTPNACVFGAICIPVAVFAFVYSMPVKSVMSDEERADEVPTDFYMIRTVSICVLIMLVAVALFLTVFCSNFTTTLIAQKIDSATLQMSRLNA